MVQPTQMHVKDVQIEIHMGLKRIADKYDNALKHRKRVLLDHVLAVLEAGISNPTKDQTRGRSTGSAQRLLSQFEHVAAALGAPMRRRQCRTFQKTGHNARTCHRQVKNSYFNNNSSTINNYITSNHNSKFRSTRL